MSKYKFKALEVSSIEASSGGRWVYVELELDTPKVKEAFLTIAGDCRGNELNEWMEELGYTIEEISHEPINREVEPEDTDPYDMVDPSLK